MRLALGIIGIALGLLVFLQSCAVATGGRIGANEPIYQAGSVGLLVGITTLIGGAFAFRLPMVAAIVFTLAALIAFLVASDFPDMRIWAFVTLALAALSFFSWLSERRSRRRGQVHANAAANPHSTRADASQDGR